MKFLNEDIRWSNLRTVLPISATGNCCSSKPADTSPQKRLADLLRRYDINEHAAPVRVYAVKPQ